MNNFSPGDIPAQDFAGFLQRSHTIGAVSVDREGIIRAHNTTMSAVLGRESLVGVALESLLAEECQPLPLPDSSAASIPLNLIFQGTGGIPTSMLCTILQGDQGFLLLAENARLRDDEILGKMSRLNNEISVISSELARSRRQIQLENQRSTLMHRHDKLSTWDLEIKTAKVVLSSNLTSWLGLEERGSPLSLEDWTSRIHPDDLPRFQQFLAALGEGREDEQQMEYRLQSHAGRWGWFSLAGWVFAHDPASAPLRLVGNHLDITEEKRALARKEELLEKVNHKLKIETVGVMTSGIIHNLNNNLGIILGSLDLAEAFLDDQAQVRNLLDSARTAAFRSRDAIDQVLGLSRSQETLPIRDTLRAVVEETLGLLPTILPPAITLDSRVASTNWSTSLKVHSTRVQEALINLCTNAIGAMGETGQLSITLDETALAGHDLPEDFVGTPGRFARLSVQDTGCGIPEDHLGQIFSLFFTSHPQEEGTGLGLATVKEIMEEHGGLVQVESTPGAGSTFHLLFPDSTMSDSAGLDEPPADLEAVTARILVVDDMADLADLGKEILVQAGFQASALYSSREVLETVRATPDRFDLVIADQAMPDISGLEMIDSLQKIAPHLKYILISGLSQTLSARELEQLGIGAFCQKPIPPANLVQVVKQVLANPATSGPF